MNETVQRIKREFENGEIDIGEAAIMLHNLGCSVEEIWEILGINPNENEEE